MMDITTKADDASQSGPVETPPLSRTARMLTSWKLWAVLLVSGVLGIGVSLTMPIVHRLRAMQFLDRHEHIGEFQLSNEHEDWPERYGEWVNALREVEYVVAIGATDEVLGHVGVLHEAMELVLRENDRQPITARGLAALQPFERLERVQLMGQGFSDEALAELFSARPPLERVTLIDTGAGHKTLRTLSERPSIEVIHIISRDLDDNAFQGLAPLQELNEIYATGLGDRGAEWIVTCGEVRDVAIINSSMTDTGLRRLCDLEDMRHLELGRVSVTDAGLAHLANLKKLRNLSFVDCPLITASGISRLPDLPALVGLALTADLLTHESVARLQELPELRVLSVFGTISDPELRTTIDEAWELDEQPLFPDEEFWQIVHEAGW